MARTSPPARYLMRQLVGLFPVLRYRHSGTTRLNVPGAPQRTPASASNPRAVASEPTGSPGRQALPVLAVSLLEHAAHRLLARSALFIRGIGTWSSSCWSQLAARSGATGGSGPVRACRLFQGGCSLPDAYFPGSPAGLPGAGMIYL